VEGSVLSSAEINKGFRGSRSKMLGFGQAAVSGKTLPGPGTSCTSPTFPHSPERARRSGRVGGMWGKTGMARPPAIATVFFGPTQNKNRHGGRARLRALHQRSSELALAWAKRQPIGNWESAEKEVTSGRNRAKHPPHSPEEAPRSGEYGETGETFGRRRLGQNDLRQALVGLGARVL
jgi:hypothetical protein